MTNGEGKDYKFSLISTILHTAMSLKNISEVIQFL